MKKREPVDPVTGITPGAMRTLVAPLAVFLPRKTMKDKKVIINLNGYRNWSFFMSNDVKKAYKEAMREQMEGIVLSTPIDLTFILYKSQNRLIDRANPLSIHEKFFCDALTEFGCIPDDNDEYISSTAYRTGGVDRQNPRVEIKIEQSSEKNKFRLK